jgi:serine/threonine-protein kinase HipA
VVPSPQVATERFLHLGVGPHGRAAELENALEGAGQFGLQRRAAAQLIEALVAGVRPWRERFDALGVSAHDSDAVENAFRRASDIGLRAIERVARG